MFPSAQLMADITESSATDRQDIVGAYTRTLARIYQEHQLRTRNPNATLCILPPDR